MQTKDLVVLVADKSIKLTIESLLNRHQAFKIRPLTFDVLVYPNRDAGCYTQAHIFLRDFTHSHSHALVVFDREFNAVRQPLPRQELEVEVEDLLSKTGWDSEKAKAVVIDPELEIWVWGDLNSPHIKERFLGWKDAEHSDLNNWLLQRNLKPADQSKPKRPKEAIEEIWEHTKKKGKGSSALFQELAQKVSFEGCKDESFNKFKLVLQQWFSDR